MRSLRERSLLSFNGGRKGLSVPLRCQLCTGTHALLCPSGNGAQACKELYCPGWWMGLSRFFGAPLYDAVHVASGNRHFEAPYTGLAQQPRPFRFDAPGWAVTQMGFARWFMHRKKTRTLPTCPARGGWSIPFWSQCVLLGKSSLLVINF